MSTVKALCLNLKLFLIPLIVFIISAILNPVYWCPNFLLPIIVLVLIATVYRIWIMSLHSYNSSLMTLTPEKQIALDEMFRRNFFANIIVYAGAHAVDVFFLISGMLMTANWLQRAKTGKFRVHYIPDWLCFIRHRIIRLYPLYLVMFGLMYTATQATLNSDCSDSFWLNIFMLGTLFLKEDCALWLWYVQDEFYFIIVAPIFLLALYHNRKLGWGLCILQVVASSVFHVMNCEIWPDLGFNPYSHPLIRISSFVFGILLGDIVYYKRQQMRELGSVPTQRRIITVIGWTLCTLSFVLTTWWNWITYMIFHDDKEKIAIALDWYSHVNYAMFSGLSAWIIYNCIFGYAPWLDRLFSFRFWSPLSNLTYAAYMVHPLLQGIIVLLAGRSEWWGYGIATAFMFGWCGTILLGFMFGFIFTLLFEIPAARSESLLMTKWRKWRENLAKRNSETRRRNQMADELDEPVANVANEDITKNNNGG